MNILLINPSDPAVYGKMTSPEHPHMGLAYIAAVIEKAGHKVALLDMHAENMSHNELNQICELQKPALVGITATTPIIHIALEIAKEVKSSFSTKIVLGGVHPTLMPKECLANDQIDFVIKGEGERTILELLEHLEKGTVPEEVEGLLYKDAKGNLIENKDRCAIADLDSLPFPARHLIKNQKYTYPDALFSPAFPIITSRGCPGKCTFCSAAFLHGRKFRFRSAENVVDEIEFLVNKYGAKEIHVWDDNFVTNKKRVFAIRDEFKKRKIKITLSFPNGVRVDSINEDILSALKDMGTYSLGFGVESGSQEILDNVQKNITFEKIETAFALAKKLKFEIWAFFLLGLPGETPATIQQTIDYAIKLDPDIAKFHILKPYPRTAVYEELLAKNLILDNDYRHYGIHTAPVHRLPDLTSEELLEWQKKAYRKFYFRPSKFIKQILRIKSFNRFKLNISPTISILKQIFTKDRE